MDLVIYGAQGIALGAYHAIHNLMPTRKVRCFLVTSPDGNPDTLGGLPVVELATFAGSIADAEKEHIHVLIATPEAVMPQIEEELDRFGMYCHVRLNSVRWARLMEYYGILDQRYTPLSMLPAGYHRADVHMYMAKFYKDKPLQERYELPTWITPIQAGAVCCKERVAKLTDCEGENISYKNCNYSELTVLYWIWKNRLAQEHIKAYEEYYGLCHYRRVLELSEDDVLRLLDNDVDVVLPFPMPYEPDIEEHHKRYLQESDWNALLTALEELYPEDLPRYQKIIKQDLLYNYNILLAKREILKAYCEWLFPILARVEELSVPKGHERSDRYIGYMGETLCTLYFMARKDSLNIAHAGCRFLT